MTLLLLLVTEPVGVNPLGGANGGSFNKPFSFALSSRAEPLAQGGAITLGGAANGTGAGAAAGTVTLGAATTGRASATVTGTVTSGRRRPHAAPGRLPAP